MYYVQHLDARSSINNLQKPAKTRYRANKSSLCAYAMYVQNNNNAFILALNLVLVQFLVSLHILYSFIHNSKLKTTAYLKLCEYVGNNQDLIPIQVAAENPQLQ